MSAFPRQTSDSSVWGPEPTKPGISDEEVVAQILKRSRDPSAAARSVQGIHRSFLALQGGISKVDTRAGAEYQHADLLLELAKIEDISTRLKGQLSLDKNSKFSSFCTSIDICNSIRDYREKAFDFAARRSKIHEQARSQQDGDETMVDNAESDAQFWDDSELKSRYDAICTRLEEISDRVSTAAIAESLQSAATSTWILQLLASNERQTDERGVEA
jgi:hypothetical protein